MAPTRCTPSEIASAARLTEKHVRRMLRRAIGAGPHVSPFWFGCRVEVTNTGRGLMADICTLPTHIREALVMRDQLELPLTPPQRIAIVWNAHRAE